MFGGQEPQPLLTCTAEDPAFNYWPEALGDRTDDDALHGQKGRQSYDWKTLAVMHDELSNLVCVKQIEKLGVSK